MLCNLYAKHLFHVVPMLEVCILMLMGWMVSLAAGRFNMFFLLPVSPTESCQDYLWSLDSDSHFPSQVKAEWEGWRTQPLGLQSYLLRRWDWGPGWVWRVQTPEEVRLDPKRELSRISTSPSAHTLGPNIEGRPALLHSTDHRTNLTVFGGWVFG